MLEASQVLRGQSVPKRNVAKITAHHFFQYIIYICRPTVFSNISTCGCTVWEFESGTCVNIGKERKKNPMNFAILHNLIYKANISTTICFPLLCNENKPIK